MDRATQMKQTSTGNEKKSEKRNAVDDDRLLMKTKMEQWSKEKQENLQQSKYYQVELQGK